MKTQRRIHSTLQVEELEPRVAPVADLGLPGLHLVDPDMGNLSGQVVYLDFDGAEDVDYHGPVEINGIDVPAFRAPVNLVGQEQAVIGRVTSELNSLFAEAGVKFVTDRPQGTIGYSTIFVGGDDSRFAAYGSFLGVAEQVDIGNQNLSDNAFVFSGILGEPDGGLEQYASDLGAVIAHETGRLLGYADSNPREDAGPLASLAATYWSAYGGNRTSNVTVTAGSHNFQVDGIAANKNTEWYVNGSYTGSAQNDWSGSFAFDPEYTYSFSSGTTQIKALIYDRYWNYEQYHIWNVSIAKPDLIVQDIAISPSSPTAGQSATITATLKNQGNANASGSIRLNYYVDGSYIGYDNLSFGLSAGASDTESISYTASSSGNHAVKVIIDPSNTVSESNEGNNERSETYYWTPPPKPDLIVQDISISPSSPISGQSATITTTLKNQGNANASGSIRLNYYVDGSYIGYDNLSFGLSAGASDTESISYTASSAGNHTVKVIIDPSNTVSESNEGNNERSETYYWNLPPKPDLIAYGISLSDTTVDPGQSISVNWTAKNQGQASAEATQQGVMWSTNGTITRGDTLLEREYLGSMGVNATSPEAHTITIPTNATPGATYYIGVYADYDLAEGESNESNNSSNAIAVTINQADLVVTDILMNGQTTLPSVRAGDNVRLDFDVLNQGDAGTDPGVHMKWWWGTSQGAMTHEIATGDLGSINGLSPGESERETDASWTIPDLSAGTYWLTAKIDYDGRVDESLEGNNTRSESFAVLESRPDLIVSSVTGVSSSYNVGDKISATAAIRNIGVGSASGTDLKYYLGTATNRTYRYIEQGSIGSLSPNQTRSDSVNWPYWTIPNDVPEGTYYIWAQADSSGTENEISEGNNWTRSSGLTIHVPQPDLVVTDILMNGQTTLPDVHSGDNVRLDFDVLNQGDAGTDPGVHMKWWWGTSQGAMTHEIATGDLGSINGLSPGESERETDASWTIPDLSAGTYWLTAKIDYDGRVDESLEGNNTRSESFAVTELPEVIDVRWVNSATGGVSQYLADAGDVVYVEVFTTGSSGSVDLDIYEEDDWDFDDAIAALTIPIGSDGRGVAAWSATYQSNDGMAPINHYYAHDPVSGTESARLQVFDLDRYSNLGTSSISELIASYAPIIKMDGADHFAPKEASIFTHGAALRDSSGASVSGWDHTLFGLSSYTGSNYWLDIPGVTHAGALSTYGSIADTYANTIYTTVVEAPAQNVIAVEYWFPYYMSDWGNHGGYNTHEGDWEGIVLYFDTSGPHRAAYAQHESWIPHLPGYAGGHYREWEDMDLSAGHPVVYVGLGGHASYFDDSDALGETPYTIPLIGTYMESHDGDGATFAPGENLSVVTLPNSTDGSLHETSWLQYGGRWGQENWTDPDTWGSEGARSPVTISRWEDPFTFLTILPEDPGGVQTVVSGTVQFEDLGELNAASGVVVDLLDASGNVLASTVADDSGHYNFAERMFAADSSVQIRASSQLGGDAARVLSSSNTLHHAYSPLTVVQTGTMTLNETISVDEGAGAFNILDAMKSGYDYLVDGGYVSASTLDGVTAYWELGSSTGTYYTNGNIYVASVLNGQTRSHEFSDSVILHEYGHYVADMAGFAQATPGGPHYINMKATYAQPGLSEYQANALAFSEGWASFFASAVLHDQGVIDGIDMRVEDVYGGSISGDFLLIKPEEGQVWTKADAIYQIAQYENVTTAESELAVWGVLWDVFDTDQDEGLDEDPFWADALVNLQPGMLEGWATDPISYSNGFQDIWAVMSSALPNTIYDLWNSWTNSSLADELARALYSRGIDVDGSAPTGSIEIDAGTPSTPDASTDLRFVASDLVSGVSQYRLSNDGNSWTSWTDFSPSASNWDITDPLYGGNSDPGIKTVYVQFKDHAGNPSGSLSDSIEYQPIIDTIPPTGELMYAPTLDENYDDLYWYYFDVTYRDNVAVDWSDIASGDILVRGPEGSGYGQLAMLFDIVPSGPEDLPELTATYRVSGMPGAWDASHNGTYTITMQGNEVSDTNDNFVAGGLLGTFVVNLPVATPTVTITASDPQAQEPDPSAAYPPPYAGGFTVSRSGGDISTELVVHYSIGGTATNDEDYAVLMDGVTIAAGESSADIYVIPRQDYFLENDETVVLTLLPGDVYDIGASNSATVTIEDTTPDLTPPTPPGTPDLIPESDSGIHDDDNITSITVPTFVWEPAIDPDGMVPASGIAGYYWAVDDDTPDTGGTFTRELNATTGLLEHGQHVFYVMAVDNAGNLGAVSSLAFTIDTVAPAAPSAPALDPESPVVTYNHVLEAIDAWQAGEISTNEVLKWINLYNAGATPSGNVTTSDNTSTLNLGWIGNNNYRLQRDGATVGDDYATPSQYTDESLSDGTYAYTLYAVDTAGNMSTPSEVLTVTIDTHAPAAQVDAENIYASGGTTHLFAATYTDSTGVNLGDIDSSDIRVTGPNGYEQAAALVSVSEGEGGALTATYQITAPGGDWDLADNGVYTLWMEPDQVGDELGNIMPSGELGSFQSQIAAGEISVGGNGALSFGYIRDDGVGGLYGTGTFTITNDGADPLRIDGMDLSTGSAFQVSNAAVTPFTIDSGDSVVVTVTFDPTTTGRQNDALTILSSDVDDPEVTVALDGVGMTPLVLNAWNPYVRFHDADNDWVQLLFRGLGEVWVANTDGVAPTDSTDMGYIGFQNTTASSVFVMQDLDPVGGSPNTMTAGTMETMNGESMGVIQMFNFYGTIENTNVDIDGSMTVLYAFGDVVNSSFITGGDLTVGLVYGEFDGSTLDIGGKANVVRVIGDVKNNSRIEVAGDLGVALIAPGYNKTIDTMTVNVGGNLSAGLFYGGMTNSTIFAGGDLTQLVVVGDVTDSQLTIANNLTVAKVIGRSNTLALDVGGNLTYGVFVGDVANSDFDIGRNAMGLQYFGGTSDTTVDVGGTVTYAQFLGGMESTTVHIAGKATVAQAFYGQLNSTLNFHGGVDYLYLYGGMEDTGVTADGDMIALYTQGGIGSGSDIAINGDLRVASLLNGVSGGNITVAGDVTSFVCAGPIENGSSVYVTGDIGMFQVTQGIKGNSIVDLGGQVTAAYLYGLPRSASIESGSIVTLGSLRGSLVAVGEVAGTVDIEDSAAPNGRNSSISIIGDLSGDLAAGVFGNVLITGSFSGTIGDAETEAGENNMLRVLTPGGGGVLTPENAFARVIGVL